MTVSYLPTHVDEECPPGCVTSMYVVNAAAITYRQLDYWTRTSLLYPIPRIPEAGSGQPRFYPTNQVERATTLRLLLDAGVSLQTCRLIVDELLERGVVRLNDALTLHLSTEL